MTPWPDSTNRRGRLASTPYHGQDSTLTKKFISRAGLVTSTFASPENWWHKMCTMCQQSGTYSSEKEEEARLNKQKKKVRVSILSAYISPFSPRPHPIRFIPKEFVKNWVNPSNAKATFQLKHKDAEIFENHLNPACWYSLDSSCWVLLNEYPCARVSVIFEGFCIIWYLPN